MSQSAVISIIFLFIYFSGRDLSKNLEGGFGTWLGVTKHGKLSFLTNFPAGVCTRGSLKGRGELIANFLKGRSTGHEYLSLLQEEKKLYGPFNLMCGDVMDGSFYYTRNVLDEGVGVQEIKGGKKTSYGKIFNLFFLIFSIFSTFVAFLFLSGYFNILIFFIVSQILAN